MLRPFFLFLLVGGLCAAINLGSLYVLVEFAATPYELALVFGFIISNAIGYQLNARFAFGNQDRSQRGLLRYYGVMLLSAALYGGLVAVGVEMLGASYILSATVVTGVMAFVNFATHKLWTFRGA